MAGQGGRRVAGAYQIRRMGTGSYSIGLPQFIGEDLVDTGIWFIAQYHDEGIILKPLAKIEADQALPAWLEQSKE
jgi:hypothetical protein